MNHGIWYHYKDSATFPDVLHRGWRLGPYTTGTMHPQNTTLTQNKLPKQQHTLSKLQSMQWWENNLLWPSLAKWRIVSWLLMDLLMSWGFVANQCQHCNTSNSKLDGMLMQCAHCKMAYYCSQACYEAIHVEHQKCCVAPKWWQLSIQRLRHGAGTKPQSHKPTWWWQIRLTLQHKK